MIGVGSALISLFLVLVCYSLTLTAKRADENLLMICEQNQKIEEEKGKQEMESKRDILRVIEKEIKKGSAPVAFAVSVLPPVGSPFSSTTASSSFKCTFPTVNVLTTEAVSCK